MESEKPLLKKIIIGGSLVLSVVAFLWLYKKSALGFKTRRGHSSSSKSETSIASNLTQSSQKLIYENPVKNTHCFELPICTPKQYRFQKLNYKIFLKITKGLGYFGSVVIEFKLSGWRKKDLKLEFNGTQILFLSINKKTISQENVQFQHHQITLPQQYLNKNLNTVQIFFYNKYSFFDDGLSTYFNVDTQNRYSLKEQCIYTKSNKYTLPRIIPCFNQQSKCSVEISLIHPDNCIAFCNGDKKSIKTFYQNDYQHLKFMFDEERLNNSSSRLSSRSLKQKVKNVTQFTKTQLNNIEQLFLASLPVTEVKTSSNTFPTIRFYCKKSIHNIVSGFIGFLLHHIENILLSASDGTQYIPTQKIDFLFVDSNSMNGYFSKGIIILNQKLIKKTLNIKTLYLVLRAFVAKFIVPFDCAQITELNRKVARIFPSCISFLRCQEIKFKQVFAFKASPQYSACYQQLYGRALKYYCPGLTASPILEQMISMWQGESPKQNFWEFYLKNIEAMDLPVLQIVTELSIRFMGKPLNQQTRQSLKQLFYNSPLVIYFMTNKQMQEDVGRVAELNSRKLQLVINSLNLSSEQESSLNNVFVQKYLKNNSNYEQCQQLYMQFLNFDEGQNFHKMEVINQQIRRLKHVIDLEQQNKQVSCSLVPAMILSRLKINCIRDKTVAKMIQLLNEVVDLE